MYVTGGRIEALASSFCDVVWLVLWQSTIVLVAVALVALCWRSGPPAARCWLWRLAAFKLLLLPVWSITVPWLAASPLGRAPVDRPGVEQTVRAPAPSSVQPPAGSSADHRAERSAPALCPCILAVWSAVVGWHVARLVWQRRRLARLLQAATPVSDPLLLTVIADLRRRLAAGAVTTVRSAETASPFVCGLLRPVLVLPEGMAAKSAQGELRAALAHELAHLERRDLVWCWLWTTARILYWFQPLVYWAARQEVLERELACDQLAMRETDCQPAAYAALLLRIAEQALAGRQGTEPAVGLDRFWRNRLSRLSQVQRMPPPVARRTQWGLALAGAVMLALPGLRPPASPRSNVGSARDRLLAEVLPLALPRPSESAVRIAAALDRPVPLGVNGLPLAPALRAVAQAAGINIYLDLRGCAADQIDPLTAIELDAARPTLAAALEQALAAVGLTYVVTDDVLFVTTPGSLFDHAHVRVYPVGDLAPRQADLDRLHRTVTATVDPPTWEDRGGTGVIVTLASARALIVAHQARTQQKVERLLVALRKSGFGKEHVQ